MAVSKAMVVAKVSHAHFLPSNLSPANEYQKADTSSRTAAVVTANSSKVAAGSRWTFLRDTLLWTPQRLVGRTLSCFTEPILQSSLTATAMAALLGSGLRGFE